MDKKHIINYDSQGWPLKEMSIKDILQSWGITISKDNLEGFYSALIPANILDIYPRTLEDDGMGYGINEKKIISSDIVSNIYCNLFVESELKNINLWAKSQFFPGANVKVKNIPFERNENYIVDNVKEEDNVIYLYLVHYKFTGETATYLGSDWYKVDDVEWE